MTNEINGFRPRSVDTPDNKSASRGAPANGRATPAGASAGSPRTDQVSLTDTAARMRELEALLAETPEIDPARVEALREAIRDGRYEVDSVHVADKLIALERSLFGKEKT
jgi:negative regulator of flagellin synthesis FlgM